MKYVYFYSLDDADESAGGPFNTLTEAKEAFADAYCDTTEGLIYRAETQPVSQCEVTTKTKWVDK